MESLEPHFDVSEWNNGCQGNTPMERGYRVAFRKKICGDLETLQTELDKYMNEYNNERTHQGKRCKGRTPMETFIEGKQLYIEKNLEYKMAA